jgi:hypothetical protein
MNKRVMAGASVAVVAVIGLAAADWVVEVRPQRPPRVVLPVPNAVDDYKRAADAVKIPDEVSKLRDEIAADAGLRHEVVAQNAEALRLLRAGFAHPYYDPPEHAATLFESNYLWRCQQLARVLICEAGEHAAAGRYAQAIDSQLDAMRLGVDIGRGAPAMAMSTLMTRTGRQTKLVNARIERLDAASAKAAARRLAAILASETLPVDSLRLERPYTAFLVGEQCRAVARDNSLWVGLSVNLRRPRIIAGCNRYLEALIAWLATGEQGDRPTAPAPDSQRFGRYVDEFSPMHGPELRHWWVNRAANELFVAALALQAWHAEHGAYPDTLDALVPGTLDALPRDPFSGGPVKYRREGDEYVLYSVGPDRKDDGGRAVDKDAQGRPTQVVDRGAQDGDYVWGVSEP